MTSITKEENKRFISETDFAILKDLNKTALLAPTITRKKGTSKKTPERNFATEMWNRYSEFYNSLIKKYNIHPSLQGIDSKTGEIKNLDTEIVIVDPLSSNKKESEV